MTTTLTYSQMEAQLINAGFEPYVATSNNNEVEGQIFTNTRKDSPFNGEVVDIFEDRTFDHYGQFAPSHPHWQPLAFKFTA